MLAVIKTILLCTRQMQQETKARAYIMPMISTAQLHTSLKIIKLHALMCKQAVVTAGLGVAYGKAAGGRG